MPILVDDVITAVRKRAWTIQDAWTLVESSANKGHHPDAHVLFPEKQGDHDVHFRAKPDFQGVEYRDRGRHSVFRNAWEAAAAICVALNTRAGEAALNACKGGRATLLSRSALIGAPQVSERLRLEYKGKTTGVSYFECAAEFAVLVLLSSKGELALKTAYPSRGGSEAPPPGKDAVKAGGGTTLFDANKPVADASAGAAR